MIIFSNTTPIIALSSINQLNLLPTLFSKCAKAMQKQGIYYNTALLKKLALQIGKNLEDS